MTDGETAQRAKQYAIFHPPSPGTAKRSEDGSIFAFMIQNATGLILRTRPLTETSLIVHWLTPDFGRIATVAKGARRAPIAVPRQIGFVLPGGFFVQPQPPFRFAHAP